MGEWSTDTRDRVAATIAAHVDMIDASNATPVLQCTGCDFTRTMPVDADWDPPIAEFEAHRADAVLTALTDAGTLLPAGGKRGSGDWRIVYGGRNGDLVWRDGMTSANQAEFSLVNARCSWPNARKQCRDTTSWPDGSVHYGPWREVADA